LNWAQDVTLAIDDARQGVLNPAGINCIRSFPGRGLLLYGARTVSSEPAWRYVNVRRMMMMIEESIEDAVQWAVFEPNDFVLQQTIARTIRGFLEPLWERGALKGASADDAFFITCDATNNPPEAIDAGRLMVEVGVAPVRPAEFVMFRVGRTDQALEVSE
jgi:phage tail sheath protein FI